MTGKKPNLQHPRRLVSENGTFFLEIKKKNKIEFNEITRVIK